MKLSHLLAAACLVLTAGRAEAQRTKSTDGEPCCSVLTINAATMLVTARDQAGKTFQFEVKDAKLLQALRIGQAVYADFATGKVRLHGGAVCCAIIQSGAIAKAVKPAEPCCGITAVDAATGIVTAREQATGRVFRFEVKDAALLKSLKVGQKVFADFGSSKVRIHGVAPCCNIVGHGM